MALDLDDGCLGAVFEFLLDGIIAWPFRMVGAGLIKVLTLGRYPRPGTSNSFCALVGLVAVGLAIAALVDW